MKSKQLSFDDKILWFEALLEGVSLKTWRLYQKWKSVFTLKEHLSVSLSSFANSDGLFNFFGNLWSTNCIRKFSYMARDVL